MKKIICNEPLKLFVYGLSGAGKDTVSNYLVNNYGFFKFRIADTIKRIICEAYNISFEELEVQKRLNSELRQIHHTVSHMLDDIAKMEQSSINRLKMLIGGKAFECQNIGADTDIIICDVRSEQEINYLLDNNYIGIFLNRRAEEYKDNSHYTEQNFFLNGFIEKICTEYNKQIFIILNETCEEKVNLTNQCFENNRIFKTNGISEDLHLIIDYLLQRNFYTNKII